MFKCVYRTYLNRKWNSLNNQQTVLKLHMYTRKLKEKYFINFNDLFKHFAV